MLETLLNQTAAPTLTRSLNFTAARHAVLAENIVNASTPGYKTKDLDVAGFQHALRERINHKSKRGTVDQSDVQFERSTDTRALTFHDGNNRSMEQLMSDSTENAMRHNMSIELLRKQYGLFHMAVRERVA